MATLDEDQVQYVLRPKIDALPVDDLPAASSMSPRTALLAGLVLGIAMMVGMLGLLAWRDRTNAPASSPSTEALGDAGATNAR
jgi:hypothetical protein